jgi:hypothetical protein
MALLLEEGSNYEEEKNRLGVEAQFTPRFNNKMTKAQIVIFGTLTSAVLLFPTIVIAKAILPETLPRISIALLFSLLTSYVILRFFDRG